MGNDFDQRKRSKRRRRADTEAETATEEGKYPRKRRAAVRRLCKGMCYNQPELTAEDKVWRGADTDDELRSSRKAAQAALTEANKVKEQAQEKKEIAKVKRKSRKFNSQQRLSTAVNMVAPSQDANTAVRAAHTEAKRCIAEGALQPYPEAMQRAMLEAGFAEPMPVQERCWPLCIKGKDVMATAEPGSGKTLAYLLPLAPRLQAACEPNRGPLTVVLVPTRELAQQVALECRALRKLFGTRVVTIIGGAEKATQVEALSKSPGIVVATPGRLLEIADEGSIAFDNVEYVVLDEADKMLSIGLKPQLDQLRRLLLPSKSSRRCPGPVVAPAESRKRPQVVMFSATTTEYAEATAARWLRRPEIVQVGATAENISRTVVQTVHVCAEHKKPQKLLKHLQQIKERSEGMRNLPRVLLFANRIKTVRFLHQESSAAGLRTVMLHGERSQPEREEAMRAFRSGKAQVMVATDVAARGLHIRGLPYVVNYDFPPSLEQYIHRAGRTGRLATDGHCYSFFTRNLAPLAQPLLRLLEDHKQAVDPNLVQLSEAYQIAIANMRASAADRAGGSAEEFVEDLLDGEAGPGQSLEELRVKAPEEDSEEDKSKEKELSQPVKQRKSLPGRLRKKLAKDKSGV